MTNVTTVSRKTDIPEGVLCTFGKKVPRGIHYFVGYRRGNLINVHFSMTKYKIDDIITCQTVLSAAGRTIKK